MVEGGESYRRASLRRLRPFLQSLHLRPEPFLTLPHRMALEPMQDLPVRRMDGYFFVLQGKKSQEYLLYCKIF